MIKINGVIIPTPSSYSISIMDISGNAQRTASGLMIRSIIATKRKIEVSWRVLSKEKLSQIFKAVSPVFFSVEYIDPEDNIKKTGDFYAGDRKASAIDYIDGKIRYKDISFNLIER